MAGPLAEAGVDFAVLVGEEMAVLAAELGKVGGTALGKVLVHAHCQSPAEAQSALQSFGLQRGDAILVKGSNSVGLGALVAVLSGKQS